MKLSIVTPERKKDSFKRFNPLAVFLKFRESLEWQVFKHIASSHTDYLSNFCFNGANKKY